MRNPPVVVALILLACGGGPDPSDAGGVGDDAAAGPESEVACGPAGTLAGCSPGSYVDVDGIAHAWAAVCGGSYELTCAEDTQSLSGPSTIPQCVAGDAGIVAFPRCADGSAGRCIDVICDGSTLTP